VPTVLAGRSEAEEPNRYRSWLLESRMLIFMDEFALQVPMNALLFRMIEIPSTAPLAIIPVVVLHGFTVIVVADAAVHWRGYAVDRSMQVRVSDDGIVGEKAQSEGREISA
jgi:hypothetical protein